MARQPLVGQGLLVVNVSRLQLDTRGRVIGPSHTPTDNATLTREKYPWPRRVSNPQSKQAPGLRPKTLTALPQGSEWNFIRTIKVNDREMRDT